MNEEELSRAAARAAELLNEALPRPEDCNHTFSPRFRRKMRHLLFRQNHPILTRGLQGAAVLFLTITVLFGSLLTVSTDAREFVSGWVKTRIETIYHFYYEGDAAQADSTEYVLGWIPDGYTLVETVDFPGQRIYNYADADKRWYLSFTYSVDSSDADIFLLNADCTQKEVTVNGIPATLYIPLSDNNSPDIIWEDREKGVLFILTAHVSEDVLIKMAENIVAKNN